MEELSADAYSMDNALDGDSDEEGIDIRAVQLMEKREQEEKRKRREMQGEEEDGRESKQSQESADTKLCRGREDRSGSNSSTSTKKDTNDVSTPEKAIKRNRAQEQDKAEMTEKETEGKGLVRDPIMDSLPDLTDLDVYSELPEQKEKKEEESWTSTET